MLAVKAGAGLAAMPHWQGDSSELIRVLDNLGLVMSYYLLMHRDMQQNPRVRAFADFVASEIKSFRALLSDGNSRALEIKQRRPPWPSSRHGCPMNVRRAGPP